MERPAADVPLAHDASERFLPWLIAFMVYLAGLALACAIVVHQLVARWDTGLSGQLTVEVPLTDPEASARERQVEVERVLAVLNGTPGVTGAMHYQPEEIAELLEPWLGSGIADQSLPLPAMIAVTIDPAQPPDLAALGQALQRAVPGTLLDDHQRWLSNLLDLARSIQLIAAVVVVLVGAAAVLAVAFVARAGLAMHGPAIELLHLMGARDAYIARQFQRHALRLGLRGGVIGTGLALATILPVGYLIERSQDGMLPSLSWSLPEWGALALLPMATALVTMVTARLTVLGTLARMP